MLIQELLHEVGLQSNEHSTFQCVPRSARVPVMGSSLRRQRFRISGLGSSLLQPGRYCPVSGDDIVSHSGFAHPTPEEEKWLLVSQTFGPRLSFHRRSLYS